MRRSILLLSACLLASTAGAQVATPRLKAAPVAQPSPGGRPGAEAIGPKQDDPRAPQGIIVQGGREAIGPKQDDPRAALAARRGAQAIGPKQDDPARPGAAAVARPGDDEDPKARCVPTGR